MFHVDATYRDDLRELNELNFARFDAKLEQRIAELRQEISGLESRLKIDLATLRADMVKWLFGMWITLLGAMIALAKL